MSDLGWGGKGRGVVRWCGVKEGEGGRKAGWGAVLVVDCLDR